MFTMQLATHETHYQADNEFHARFTEKYSGMASHEESPCSSRHSRGQLFEV